MWELISMWFFSDKWFLNSDAQEVNLRNCSEPQPKTVPSVSPIYIRWTNSPVSQRCPWALRGNIDSHLILGEPWRKDPSTHRHIADDYIVWGHVAGMELLPPRRVSSCNNTNTAALPSEADLSCKPPKAYFQATGELPVSESHMGGRLLSVFFSICFPLSNKGVAYAPIIPLISTASSERANQQGLKTLASLLM